MRNSFVRSFSFHIHYLVRIAERTSFWIWRKSRVVYFQILVLAEIQLWRPNLESWSRLLKRQEILFLEDHLLFVRVPGRWCWSGNHFSWVDIPIGLFARFLLERVLLCSPRWAECVLYKSAWLVNSRFIRSRYRSIWSISRFTESRISVQGQIRRPLIVFDSLA